jgi:hypothetical protein
MKVSTYILFTTVMNKQVDMRNCEFAPTSLAQVQEAQTEGEA